MRACGCAGGGARALIISEEEKVLHSGNRAAESAAILILAEDRAIHPRAVIEKVVRVEDVVAEEFKRITMIFIAPGLERDLNVAAAVASLRGVIQRGLRLNS